MDRGLYTAAAGMLANIIRQESLVHNLANVRTPGYKADQVTMTDFPSMLLAEVRKGQTQHIVGPTATGVTVSDISTDFQIGAISYTGHPYDFAVAGEGFFRVQTPDGIRYTRDGTFYRDLEGTLLTSEGYQVLGENGTITIPEGEFVVNPAGTVFVDGEVVAQLSLATFEDTDTLIKETDTLFNDRDGGAQVLDAADIQIYQAYLEDSNVDTAKVATEMMAVMKAYQMSQRLVQFQDEINGKAVNDLGRV